jgi:hypothetical protein
MNAFNVGCDFSMRESRSSTNSTGDTARLATRPARSLAEAKARSLILWVPRGDAPRQ